MILTKEQIKLIINNLLDTLETMYIGDEYINRYDLIDKSLENFVNNVDTDKILLAQKTIKDFLVTLCFNNKENKITLRE